MINNAKLMCPCVVVARTAAAARTHAGIPPPAAVPAVQVVPAVIAVAAEAAKEEPLGKEATLGSKIVDGEKSELAKEQAKEKEEAKPKDKSRPVSSTPIPGTPWCVVWTGDGRVFFFNPSTRTSVWEKPDELKNKPEVDKLMASQPDMLNGKMRLFNFVKIYLS